MSSWQLIVLCFQLFGISSLSERHIINPFISYEYVVFEWSPTEKQTNLAFRNSMLNEGSI